MLPDKCPMCGGPMRGGFVHADNELVLWNNTSPNDCVERPEELQKPPVVKSFRLSNPAPEPLPARRCDSCRAITLSYGDSGH